MDEAASISYAVSGVGHLWQSILDDPNMSLYYVVLHFWLRLGTDMVTVRTLSALFAIVTVFPFYSLCSRLFGREHAIFASVILSLNGLCVHFFQDARGYSLLVFLVILGSLLFVRALDERGLASWSLYVLVMSLAVYAHFFAALVILAHCCFALLTRRTIIGQVLLAGIAITALVSPLVWWISRGHGVRPTWIQRPPLVALLGVADDLTGNGDQGLILVYFISCALALGAVFLPRLPVFRSMPRDRDGLVFALLWLFVPILTSFVYSRLREPIFVSRYLLVSVPPLAMVGALGIVRLKGKVPRALLGILLLTLSASSVIDFYRTPSEDWRSAATFVKSLAAPGDSFVFHHTWVRRPFEYYASRLGFPVPLPAWTGGDKRVWLILSYTQVPGPPLPVIPETYSRQAERSFPGVDVFLYRRSP